MEIIDTHFHIWDLQANYYPWLTDRITPRSFGDYAPIRRDYGLSDFKADIGTRRVVKAVHVQAEIDPRDPVRETRWIEGVAQGADGFLAGIVAFADLFRRDAEAVLAQHVAFSRTRGIRQLIHQYRFDPEIAYPLADPVWRENFGLLRRFDLSFDLNLFAREMPDAAGLVRAHADTQFIVGHMGMPTRTGDPNLAGWRAGMAKLAESENVAVKISGFGIAERTWSVESMRPLVLHLVDLFGIDRCTFGSNYPVESLSATYDAFWSACEAITSGFSAAERCKLFHDNAVRLYRL